MARFENKVDALMQRSEIGNFSINNARETNIYISVYLLAVALCCLGFIHLCCPSLQVSTCFLYEGHPEYLVACVELPSPVISLTL